MLSGTLYTKLIMILNFKMELITIIKFILSFNQDARQANKQQYAAIAYKRFTDRQGMKLYPGMITDALKRKYEPLKGIYNHAIVLCFYPFICRVCLISRLNAV